MEDTKIVEFFHERNEDAILHTSEKYGKRLVRLSQGIVGDLQTAEECENDTYVAAWNSIPPHNPVDYLYAFLARITRNLSLNCCRDRKRLKRDAFVCELSAEMEQCIPAPNDCECRIEVLAFAEILNAFLASLEKEKRMLFLRRYFYLDSVASISERFGVSESKVKTTLYRIRAKLREYLEKEGYTL